MRRMVGVVLALVSVTGCAATVDSGRVAPADTRPAVAQRPAIPTQPGCPEPSHQPFPPSGTYVPVDELAEATTKVAPSYPNDARESRAQGVVLVRALVCEHGRVVKTEIAQSIPLLDEAAMTAVMQWTFRPARSGGSPVAVWVDTPVRFTLH